MRWAHSARRDFIRITDHYAAVAPGFPLRLLDQIDVVARRLLDWPDLGALLENLPYRKYLVPGTKYLLFYQPSADGIEIMRVVHGAEDWQGL